ncbi:MAG: hypothetical protein ACOX6L_12310, partial [Syntrophomonadaceae bacterium]
KNVVLPNVVAVSPSGEFSPGKENLTSDGRPKATAGDSLSSYAEYAMLKNYFLQPRKGMYGIRNFALLTIGIATGLRISDLVSLKVGHLITVNEYGSLVFKDTIDIYEQKTGKRTVGADDSVVITEAIQNAVSELLQAYAKTSKRTKTPKTLNLDDWLFQSKQPITSSLTKDKKRNLVPNPLQGEYVLTEEGAHAIFKKAQRDLVLTFDLCTRTTRKTFASLYTMFSRQIATGNTAGIELTQIALRHSSARKTMHYLGVTRKHTEWVRGQISDWLMGRSEHSEIRM